MRRAAPRRGNVRSSWLVDPDISSKISRLISSLGSSIKHVLITEAVAQRKEAPIYLIRGQQHKFHAMFAAEEEEWEARLRRKRGEAESAQSKEAGSFEEYREKSKAAGMM